MSKHKALWFEATLEIIGVNPFVFIPEKLLSELLSRAGRQKGPIPVCGTVNKISYKQTLVKFKGDWRLYINTMMLKHSPKRVGEVLSITIDFDPVSRKIEAPEQFTAALSKNSKAKKAFELLTPSRRQEIIRYLAKLKTEKAREANTKRAINFLLGKERFVGREKL